MGRGLGRRKKEAEESGAIKPHLHIARVESVCWPAQGRRKREGMERKEKKLGMNKKSKAQDLRRLFGQQKEKWRIKRRSLCE